MREFSNHAVLSMSDSTMAVSSKCKQDLSVQIVFFTFSCKWFLCFYFWVVIWSYIVDTACGCHTFLCKFWHFQTAVSQWKLAWLTPNLGILWISVSSFWLCESIVANPIIYRLVPRPSRFEIRQYVPLLVVMLFFYTAGINSSGQWCRLRLLSETLQATSYWY